MRLTFFLTAVFACALLPGTTAAAPFIVDTITRTIETSTLKIQFAADCPERILHLWYKPFSTTGQVNSESAPWEFSGQMIGGLWNSQGPIFSQSTVSQSWQVISQSATQLRLRMRSQANYAGTLETPVQTDYTFDADSSGFRVDRTLYCSQIPWTGPGLQLYVLRIASGYSQLPRFPNTTGVVIDGSFCGNGCTTTAWNHTWTMNKGSALTATIHYSPLDPSAVDLMGDNDSNSASTWTGPILRTANITTDQTYHLYVHLNAAGENDALENAIQTWFEGQPTLAVGDADAHTRLRLATSPNPARGEVRITYTLPRDGGAEITVHDVLGRRVATLASGAAAAGTHEARWDGHATDGATARAGVYLVRVRLADGTTTSTRLVRIR